MTDDGLHAAAQWAERRRDDTRARQAFADWRADTGNAAAWEAVDTARADSVALADHPALLGLRHATLARAVRDRPRRRRRGVIALAAAASVAIAAPLALSPTVRETLGIGTGGPVVYATERGQRLNVTLTDGSRLTLDTDSRVRVAYTDTRRQLFLDRGQALFEVAKQQARPFVVTAGTRRIVAHGTKFDVRLAAAGVRVALMEGKVSVSAAGAPPVAMVPDDVLTANPVGVSIRHLPGRAQALASWSDGVLVFDDETLAGAVAEINRYAARPVTIADPTAARLRISGSFRTGETAPFLEALALGFPVRIARQADGAVRISTRS